MLEVKKLTWWYGGIRVVRVSDDLGGSSRRGRGGNLLSFFLLRYSTRPYEWGTQ